MAYQSSPPTSASGVYASASASGVSVVPPLNFSISGTSLVTPLNFSAVRSQQDHSPPEVMRGGRESLDQESFNSSHTPTGTSPRRTPRGILQGKVTPRNTPREPPPHTAVPATRLSFKKVEVANESGAVAESSQELSLSARRLEEAMAEEPPRGHRQVSGGSSSQPGDGLSTFLLGSEVVQSVVTTSTDSTVDVTSQSSVCIANARFQAKTDRRAICGLLLLGLIMLAITGLFLFYGVSAHQGSMIVWSVVCFLIAIFSAVTSLVLCLRFRAPAALSIQCVDEVWYLILERRCAAPRIRPLVDLEAFGESFGYFTSLGVSFSGKSVGFTTSFRGTLNLFFAHSADGPPILMVVSLQDPYLFFKTLRDIMRATGHGLTAITENYVDDWDGNGSNGATIVNDDASLRESFEVKDKSVSAVGA